jgi:hypothetical protein
VFKHDIINEDSTFFSGDQGTESDIRGGIGASTSGINRHSIRTSSRLFGGSRIGEGGRSDSSSHGRLLRDSFREKDGEATGAEREREEGGGRRRRRRRRRKKKKKTGTGEREREYNEVSWRGNGEERERERGGRGRGRGRGRGI